MTDIPAAGLSRTAGGVSQRMLCRFSDFSDVQSAFDYHGLLIATDRRDRAAYTVRAQLEPYVRSMGPVYAATEEAADVVRAALSQSDPSPADLRAAWLAGVERVGQQSDAGAAGGDTPASHPAVPAS